MMKYGPGWRWIARIGRVALILVYGVPLLWVVLTSFKTEAELGQSLSSVVFTPTLSAYRAVGGSLVTPIIRSIEVCAGTALLVIVLATLACFGLTHIAGRAARAVIRASLALFVLLQMIPQPTTVIPFYATLASQHLINSLVGLIVADSALLLPLAVLLLRPFFQEVPKELEDAASIDGASLRIVLYRVVVPLVRNGLVTVGVLIFAITWGEFIYAATFLNAQGLLPISVMLLN
jgi:multiple sugar transport system permease protein